jgi:hypothetical protein
MNLPGISEFTPEFFNESSKAWQKNKIRCGASYAYKCLYIHSNQKQCKHPSTNSEYCKRHYILLKSRSNGQISKTV